MTHTEASQIVIDDTRRWLERAVIGLNLCPFAKSVHVKGQVHYAVSAARNAERLLDDLIFELKALLALDGSARDTTLLIAPDCMGDFLDFNDFLARADRTLAKLKLDGVLQIASLHPNYQFAGTAEDDITNFTNRSPYPTLHLLREERIEQALLHYPNPEQIPKRNVDFARKAGLIYMKTLRDNCF